MSCFSLSFWEGVCIYIVIVIAVWSIIKLLLPFVTQYLPTLVIQIINIILWVIIAIFCIIIIFSLLGCLIGGLGGIHFPR